MKVISKYKDFVNELEKGVREIHVTEEFYEWLDANIKLKYVKDTRFGIVGTLFGARVIKEENGDENGLER